jgi:maltose O-acetyltransferase
MTQREKMLKGELYIANDPELRRIFLTCKELVRKYNKTITEAERTAILKQLLGNCDEATYMEPPIYFDYGINTSIGKEFYSNTNLVILDVARVMIGDDVMLGPNVAIYTAGHPLDKELRRQKYEYGKEVKIGNDVWIGGNVVINPGVTIGNNVVIGSGSVVTKDIPSNVVAAGNPCRIIKHLTAKEKSEKDYFVQI